LRRLYLKLLLTLPEFGIAFAFIEPWKRDRSAVPWIVAVVAIGIVCIGSLAVRSHRPLPNAESPNKLAGAYRAELFIGIGLAEAPALFGMAIGLYAGQLKTVFVGMSFALVGFWIICPDKRDVARRQAEIDASGSQLSLIGTLRGSDALE